MNSLSCPIELIIASGKASFGFFTRRRKEVFPDPKVPDTRTLAFGFGLVKPRACNMLSKNSILVWGNDGWICAATFLYFQLLCFVSSVA